MNGGEWNSRRRIKWSGVELKSRKIMELKEEYTVE